VKAVMARLPNGDEANGAFDEDEPVAQ
jgi:hypothetical protein